MEKRKTKKDIVKMLLRNNELDERDEEELIDLLFDQPIAIDVDKQEESKMTFGDRVSDKVSEVCGSWGFIIWFTLIVLVWMGLNFVLIKIYGDAFDPYPFILLNLVLSCISALQAPFIMMSQNRSAKKDSMRAKNDYKTDLKSELILEELHDEIKKLQSTQNKILKLLNEEKKEDKSEE